MTTNHLLSPCDSTAEADPHYLSETRQEYYTVHVYFFFSYREWLPNVKSFRTFLTHIYGGS